MIGKRVRKPSDMPSGAQPVSAAPAADSPKTEGLTPLDRERAASVADEGGTSAAAVEADETGPNETGPNETGPNETGPDETDPDETPRLPSRALVE